MFEPFIHDFRRILGDPAQVMSADAKHPEFRILCERYLSVLKPTFPIFPDVSQIGAVQISLFDNGEQAPAPSRAKRPRTRKVPLQKSRYAVSIQVWTDDATRLDGKSVAWATQVFLWTAAEAILQVNDLIRRKIIPDSPAMQALVKLAGDVAGNPNAIFGIPQQYDRRMGRRWCSDLFVAGSLDRATGELACSVYPTAITAEDFVDFTAGGKPLSGNCVGSCRISYRNQYAEWAS
jgi:hypothetical protein